MKLLNLDLTLTSVVFEYYIFINIFYITKNLTLTSVVFESYNRDEK